MGNDTQKDAEKLNWLFSYPNRHRCRRHCLFLSLFFSRCCMNCMKYILGPRINPQRIETGFSSFRMSRRRRRRRLNLSLIGFDCWANRVTKGQVKFTRVYIHSEWMMKKWRPLRWCHLTNTVVIRPVQIDWHHSYANSMVACHMLIVRVNNPETWCQLDFITPVMGWYLKGLLISTHHFRLFESNMLVQNRTPDAHLFFCCACQKLIQK